ncbi:hypothetical protein FBY40_1604 [Microbacterium sp. SLBN-154]|uniref:hypothetical protein n=1 Tax=Microbacterium sp. SLBN-154 TaxID=2768458 RepID=UPI001150027C|nr:hypothetical protein [Microbacterium sp. SLBN-154]TQK19113.1 hypothetical protein FBY40_1604 [Microbacterium sp. SLBN-154]
MITLSPTTHTHDNGIETYSYPSTVRSDELHCITRTDGGPWRIAPVDAVGVSDLTIQETKRFVEEIRFLIRMAESLERAAASATKAAHPADAAITAEVQALLGDREWTINVAADAAGMTRAKLLHRLNGHSSWTLADLGDLAGAFSRDDEDRSRLLNQLTRTALDAVSASTATVAA